MSKISPEFKDKLRALQQFCMDNRLTLGACSCCDHINVYFVSESGEHECISGIDELGAEYVKGLSSINVQE